MDDLRKLLTNKGLKVTPQRIAVLESVMNFNNHPTADKIIELIKSKHPNIAIGTVYNILETYVKKNIIKKVTTEKDIMRYDPIMEKHHHLYCSESDRIEDYFDEELDELLEEYFKNKKITDFSVENIKLQIIGKFSKKK